LLTRVSPRKARPMAKSAMMGTRVIGFLPVVVLGCLSFYQFC
jgi:hypothetical protein